MHATPLLITGHHKNLLSFIMSEVCTGIDDREEVKLQNKEGKIICSLELAVKCLTPCLFLFFFKCLENCMAF